MRKRYDVINNGDSAKVYLYGPVGSQYFDGVDAAEFVQQIDELDVDNIELRINSPGGSVWDGFAIANVLSQHRATVTAYIDGLAASIATVIPIHGADSIHIAKNGRMMVHNAALGVDGVFGDADDLEGFAEDIKKLSGELRDINDDIVAAYVEQTGQDEAQIRAWMTEETFFDAQTALDHGFVDTVVRSARVVAAKWDGENYQARMAACLRGSEEIPEVRLENAFTEREIPEEVTVEPRETPLLDAWENKINARLKATP